MKKVNKKKGFTLAELLVVLAILAILVAVAVPLFTGAIGDAKQTAIDANVRAVRAAGVTKILTDDTAPEAGPWYVTASVDKSGEMSDVEFTSGPESIPSDPVGTYIVEIKDVNA